MVAVRWLAENWAWAVGVPVIIGLCVNAARRVMQIRARMEQVRDELARSPLPPMAQMAELFEPQSKQERSDGKRAD